MKDTVLESIRKECVVAVEDLLTVHAPELDNALEMLDGVVTVNLACKIDTTGPKPAINTKLGFYINRCKDERSSVIDEDQGKLF